MNELLENELKKTEDEIVKEIEDHFKFEDLKRFLEKTLIRYMKKYEKKDYRMNPIFINIRKTLRKEEEITERQFDSIIKWIERERPFRRYERKEIYEYFSPVISKTNDRILVGTLDNFFH